MRKSPTLIILSCLAGFLCLATGCNDDEQEATPPDPREETLDLLTGPESKAWMIQSLHVNGANVTSYLEECNTDDHYVLYRDGRGEVLGMDIKCFENEPPTLATGTWELHDELETISINLPPIALEEVELYELTEERLQLRKIQDQETILVTYTAVQ